MFDTRMTIFDTKNMISLSEGPFLKAENTMRPNRPFKKPKIRQLYNQIITIVISKFLIVFDVR